MTLSIAGRGWVTPLGSDIDAVWQRLVAGETAKLDRVCDPISERSYPAFRVPPDVLTNLPLHVRLRRASAISRFAAAAGLAAINEAKVALIPETAERIALIFAIANGGVVYTKRFYHDIVASGASAASPLLFPETVFNAPASHLAAMLGISGASYTLVGDNAVAGLAMQMASDLMQNDALDHCLVVAAEEADWLLCDAYAKWRLVRSTPPIEPFARPPRGMILSEGAGAVLISRSGETAIDRIASGTNFRKRSEAAAAASAVFADLQSDSAIIIASANGTFIDAAEEQAIHRHCPDAITYTPKAALGESVGASGMWQIICADQALRTRTLPHGSPRAGSRDCAIVSMCGMNQQVAGLRLRRSA